MNKIVLLGRLTKEPEMRYAQGDKATAICKYTLAVQRRVRRDGEPDADFIPCVSFGNTAEFAQRNFHKGMQVAVSGRIQVRSWDDDHGQRRWATEVVVEDQSFAESKRGSNARENAEDYADNVGQPAGAYAEQRSQHSTQDYRRQQTQHPAQGYGRQQERQKSQSYTQPSQNQSVPNNGFDPFSAAM